MPFWIVASLRWSPEASDMELGLRQNIIRGAALGAAVAAGWMIADGSFGLVAVLAGIALLVIVSVCRGIAPDAFVMGAVLVGYLVGNRGFAQLHVPNLPLLPAEFALGLGVVVSSWRWARQQQLPLRRDLLNIAILLWIALTAIRLPMDFRQYGFLAVRDFAMVYYAVFFFLAQSWARELNARVWLTRSLELGFALVAPVFAAFLLQPEWFTRSLTAFGVPLIFVKSDVAGGLMAAGAFWFLARYAATRGRVWLLLSAISLLGVGISNSRAALVAVLVGVVWLVVLRAWRMLRVLGAFLAIALAVLLIEGAISRGAWQQTQAYRLYEAAASMLDFRGTRSYASAVLGDKPDNNQFRLVWWRALVSETWREGKLLGLGFGYDLAGEFSRVYYADANEDFSARSPHNFFLTVFARTGLIGASLLLVVCFAAAAKTWRCRGHIERPDRRLSLWLAVWPILASACFGVVLEGPMGAVVFWTLLGLANAADASRDAETTDEDSAHAALPAASPPRELTSP